MPKIELIQGDCLEKMKDIPDGSVDAIVTDPPYGLSFMGKNWDKGVPGVEFWIEMLRVLKPGGYLLSFSGTRTYHRMAVAIEDAGFEVRDMIEWVYGSGFPKSLNIGKAVDKIDGRKNINTLTLKNKLNEYLKTAGYSKNEVNKLCGFEASNYFRTDNHLISVFPTKEKWEKIKKVIQCGTDLDSLFEEAEREVVGKGKSGETAIWQENGGMGNFDITNGTSEWEGWGTALKPAHEPICMARKPLSEKTIAENVLKYGTGGINIDESRVGTEKRKSKGMSSLGVMHDDDWKPKDIETESTGRFPANLIHDGSDEVRECFPETKTGGSPSKNPGKYKKNGMFAPGESNISDVDFSGDSGNASRFFKSIPQGRFPANLIHDNSEEVRECFPETKSGSGNKNTGNRDGIFGKLGKGNGDGIGGDSGNASRFFKSIPAHEPICMARKPLAEKTVAENVLKWGTGGINIDESRVGYQGESDKASAKPGSRNVKETSKSTFVSHTTLNKLKESPPEPNGIGRFPANLIHDNSEEVRECFPETGQPCGSVKKTTHKEGMFGIGQPGVIYTDQDGDNRSASRFFKSIPNDRFIWSGTEEELTEHDTLLGEMQDDQILTKEQEERYEELSKKSSINPYYRYPKIDRKYLKSIIYQAKASKSERNKGCEGLEEKTTQGMRSNAGPALVGEDRKRTQMQNNHPTVKPTALMEYLINMVTAEGGTVLDPFMGSGTTGVACKNLNRDFIGIELDEQYFMIAQERIEAA